MSNDDAAPGADSLSAHEPTETSFEKRRGVATVEIREGFAQVQVTGLEGPNSESAIEVLEIIAREGLSIDFLKFTQNGLSFLIPEGDSTRLDAALCREDVANSINHNRHVVIVYAVNMRDEEGLLAHVMRAAISSGVAIEHVTDMHDRMLMVVDSKSSTLLSTSLKALCTDRGGYAL